MAVPEDHRAPGTDVVDVAVPIDIEQISAIGSIVENRRTADGPKRAGRAVNASGHKPLCTLACGGTAVVNKSLRARGGHQTESNVWTGVLFPGGFFKAFARLLDNWRRPRFVAKQVDQRLIHLG